ncbi:ATP synthase F0 subunit B [bacterium]|nr:MAG: ATP synthase F0 subunit B [bacterium]
MDVNFLLIAIFAESSSGKNPLTAVTPGLYIWTIITFLLLFYVLAKFAWKPLLGMLEERENLIKTSLNNAETARKELEKINLESEAIITKARTDAQSILSDGKAAAEKIKDDTVAKAKEEANKIKEEAKLQIKAEKDKAISDIKKEVVDLSISVAEKLINKNISEQDNSSLIEESLKEIKQYEA